MRRGSMSVVVIAVSAALLCAVLMATSANAQVRPPAYGEGPGATGPNVPAPVRELPATGSGPQEADHPSAPFVLGGLTLGVIALGMSMRARRHRPRA
jgi:hypothetical protein